MTISQLHFTPPVPKDSDKEEDRQPCEASGRIARTTWPPHACMTPSPLFHLRVGRRNSVCDGVRTAKRVLGRVTPSRLSEFCSNVNAS